MKNYQLVNKYYIYGCKKLRKDILNLLLFCAKQESNGLTQADLLALCLAAHEIKKIEGKLNWSQTIHKIIQKKTVLATSDLKNNNYFHSPF